MSKLRSEWRCDAKLHTSSRPPLDGADGGTVEDKLLRVGVKRGRGLQSSEVSPCGP